MIVDSRIVMVRDETVEKAIAEGLGILQADRDEVEIEIIDRGKKGLLGIGRKMAKVKLTIKGYMGTDNQTKMEDGLKAGKNEANEESIYNTSIIPGKNDNYRDIIQLEKGRIVLKQLYRGKYPVIKAGAGIELYEEGQLITGPVVLTENRNIMYQEKDRPAESEITITVSDDKMKACLEIRRNSGKLYDAVILPAGSDDIDFIVTAKVLKELPPKEITVEDVCWKLEEEGISKGIKIEEIEKAIHNPGRAYLIAEGKPVTEGADAWIEYLYRDKNSGEEPDDPLKNIDYYSNNDILTVKKGEILAVKHPLREGKNGYNIYGEELMAAEYKDIEWCVGEGIEIAGNKAIATKAGRPVIEKGYLKINEIYLVTGDVDINVGNISFDGDVYVIGNVCDNFRIEAGGMIKVAGNVTQAVLKAEGDIIVKGKVINSKIIAGGLSAFYHECSNCLDSLKNNLAEMLNAISQLKNQKSFRTDDLRMYGERQIIQLLVDTKYKNVLNIVKDLYSKFRENERNSEYILDELKLLLYKLKEKIKTSGLCTFKNSSEIKEMVSSIEDVLEMIKKIENNDCNIWTTYIQKSDLRASGSVVIAGEGAYNSNIYAGNKVIFKGRPGLFRGGKIIANNDVYIKEIGSPGGSKVEIEVPADCKIRAKKVYSNVFVKIGELKYIFNYDYGNITTVHIDGAGKLRIA